MANAGLTNSSLKSLEELYAQVPKTSSNYFHYITVLTAIVNCLKRDANERKKVGILLGGK